MPVGVADWGTFNVYCPETGFGTCALTTRLPAWESSTVMSALTVLPSWSVTVIFE